MNSSFSNRPDRGLRRFALVGAGALALTLGGCSFFGVQTVAPRPTTPVPTVAETSATPTPTPTQTPTPTPTTASPTAAAVKATGNLNFYSEVSSAMAGTCTVQDGLPTLTVTDEANDFFERVTVTVVLNPAKSRLLTFGVETGEDSEGTTWKLGYDSSAPAKGTSAKLVVNGSTYRVSGNATAVEVDSDGGKRTEVIPFGATVKCADLDW